MASVEVLAGPERRRRWSIEQKQSIVAAAFEPGAMVREVARQCDVTASLIYRWRRDLRAAANGFARVVVAPAGDGITAAPAIEIEFPGDARVRIPASVSPAVAAAVVCGLGAAMIPIPSGVRVWLAVGRTDMRNYAERTIMWSPRRRCYRRRGFRGGITSHNSLVGRRCSAWRSACRVLGNGRV